MTESKIFMCPDQGVDNALLASTLANQNNGMNSMFPMMAMMNGGMNGLWNNPLNYILKK